MKFDGLLECITYGKDLVNELKRECSGDFEDVMVGLMETPTKYDVLQLHKAVKVNFVKFTFSNISDHLFEPNLWDFPSKIHSKTS
uniref:Uncharacterized protein n=1 Tax=Parascaris equorum TaxID=6256 RepID=A0A914S2E0_PAREQ